MVAVCAELPEEVGPEEYVPTGPEAAVSEAWVEIEAAVRSHWPGVTADDLQMVEFGCDVLVCRLARLATATGTDLGGQ